MDLAYILRAYTISNEEARLVDMVHVGKLQQRFVRLFEMVFGKFNCTYSVHQVLHLDLVRAKGPLTETSAFTFEALFGLIRRCFKPGTPNPIKQAFEKIYMKDLKSHCCKRGLSIVSRTKKQKAVRTNDSLFYTFTESVGYRFYQMVPACHPGGVGGPGHVHCYKIATMTDDNDTQDWSRVGVFFNGTREATVESVPKADIYGKAIEVGDYIMTVANGVLREAM